MASKIQRLYAIEYEKVIKNDLHPTKEGLTMGEVIKEINIQSKGECCNCNGCWSTSNDCLSDMQSLIKQKVILLLGIRNYGLWFTCSNWC